MAEITIDSINAQRDKLTEFALQMGEEPGYTRHQYLEQLVQKSPKYQSFAALHSVWDYIPEGNRQDLVDTINMGIQGYGHNPAPFTQEEYQNRFTFALDAANNSLPAIVEHKASKERLVGLIMEHASREPAKGSNSTFHSYKQDVMNTIHTLFGETKVFNNNTPMKVGFPKRLLKAANVSQSEWTESADYFFTMAHRKYKGSLSFVPRVNVVNKMRSQSKWAESMKYGGDVPEDDDKYIDAEGVERQRINTQWDAFNRDDDKWMQPQENRISQYNKQWKTIYNDIVTRGGGNIWIERINDSKDMNRIRLVIVSGDRNDPDNVKIIGDVYGDNQGRSETAGFTRENSIKFMQARQAWQFGNSQDDAWDTEDWIHNVIKVVEYAANKLSPAYDAIVNAAFTSAEYQTLGMSGEESNTGPISLDGIAEEGGDLSRDEFETLNNAYSKGAWEKKHNRKFIQSEFEAGEYEGLGGYSDLNVNSLGGRYLTEFTLPGRVEADMFLEPLMNEIYAHEKSIGRKLTHEPEDQETIYELVRVVKGRLNRNPDFFEQGTSIFSYVLNNGQNLFNQPINQQTPLTDYIGRSIRHLQGPEGEALFNIARKLSPYLPDKDRPSKTVEILDPSTWELKPPMHGWFD